jgi:hypothetical protein
MTDVRRDRFGWLSTGGLRMRLISTAAAGLVLAATLAAPVAYAQDCQSLWVERNTYYKNAGYCFKTQRAIQYFGNAGCYINNESQIRFPPGIAARIQQIRGLERAMGCPI